MIGSLFILVGLAQDTGQWTENDRKYLLDNLVRTRDLIINETEGLSKKQWDFKESPRTLVHQSGS